MSEDNKSKSEMPNSKKFLLLGTAAALLIGAYIFGTSFEIHPNRSEAKTDSQIPETIPMSSFKLFPSDQVLGNINNNAIVTMVEYGSLTCPHCAAFHQEQLSKIKADYIETNKIRYIYRDYPLDGAALKASLLARCDADKRMAFLDLLYKKQTEWTKGNSIEDIVKNLTIIGKIGGLSAKQVEKCLNDEAKTKEILDVQKESAKLYNIEATPTVIINDQKFSGGKKAAELKNLFDKLLKGDKPQAKN